MNIIVCFCHTKIIRTFRNFSMIVRLFLCAVVLFENCLALDFSPYLYFLLIYCI